MPSENSKKLKFYRLLSSGHCPSILGRPLGICPEQAVRGYATGIVYVNWISILAFGSTVNLVDKSLQ